MRQLGRLVQALQEVILNGKGVFGRALGVGGVGVGVDVAIEGGEGGEGGYGYSDRSGEVG